MQTHGPAVLLQADRAGDKGLGCRHKRGFSWTDGRPFVKGRREVGAGEPWGLGRPAGHRANLPASALGLGTLLRWDTFKLGRQWPWPSQYCPLDEGPEAGKHPQRGGQTPTEGKRREISAKPREPRVPSAAQKLLGAEGDVMTSEIAPCTHTHTHTAPTMRKGA